MYEAIRLLISVIVLIILLYALKRIKKRNRLIISISTAVVLFIALCYLPFENYFFSFDSAASAYRYYDPTYKVELVVPGYDSDFVVAKSKKGSFNNKVVPKQKDGYKIATNIQTGIIEKYRDGHDDIFVDVYYHKNSDDFYLSVRNIDGETLEISDTMSSEFFEYKEADSRYNSGITYYYTSVKNPDNNYRLIINGEKIALDFIKYK